MELEKQRDIGNDLLRGLAIVCVILIHTTADWGQRSPPDDIYRIFYSIYRPVLDIWIPIFLFISGYYIGRTQIKSFADYHSFLRRRLSRILPPYLIWSTVLFIPGFVAGRYTIMDLPIGIMLGKMNYPYFFVPMIINFYVLYPLFYFCACKRWLATFSFCLLILPYIYVTTGSNLLGIREFWVTNVPQTVKVHWIVFFFAGILVQNGYFSSWAEKKPINHRAFPLIICVFTLALSLVSGKFVALFAMSLIFCVNSYMPKDSVNRFTCLSYLGQKSYTVYLLHEPSLRFTRQFMDSTVPMLSAFPILQQIPLITVALGSPFVQAWLFQRILGAKAKYVVG